MLIDEKEVQCVAKDYAQSFYNSKRWKKIRKAYFKRMNGICERCSEAGDVVHHRTYITPANIHNPEITLNLKNLEVLCGDCHNKEHKKKEAAKTRYRVDANGNISPPGVRKTDINVDTDA